MDEAPTTRLELPDEFVGEFEGGPDEKVRRREKIKAMLPVPKVLLPTLAGLGAIGATWIATGDFSRLELSQLFLTGWYAVIGWAAPDRSS